MVVGAFASGSYAEPRFTNDIDIVLELSPSQLDALIAKLPAEHFYVSREAAMSAIENAREFNVIHGEGGVKIDFIIARRDAWGIEQLQRRRRRELLTGVKAFT